MIIRASFFILICFLTTFFSALGQETPDTKKNCEQVIISGVQVACFAKGIGSFSTRERALAVERRIEKIVSDLSFDLEKISATSDEVFTSVVANEFVILSFQDGDLEFPKAENRMAIASEIVENVRNAVKQSRDVKSTHAIGTGAVYSVVATICLALLLLLLNWLFPKVLEKIKSIDGKYIKTLRIQSFEILNSTRIISFLMWVTSAIRIFITLLLFYIYIPLLFSFFPWTSDWTPKLFGYILDPLNTVVRMFINYIPNIFFIVVIALFIRYTLKIVKFLFTEIGKGTLKLSGFYKEWADPTYKLVRFLILAFGFIMAFPYLPGSNSPAFRGVSVFLGILLSLGSSSAIANMVAGVVLTYMRPFKIGDRVKIGDTVGDVKEKTLLVTRVRSIKNVDITIPNSMVLGSHIINYSSTSLEEGLILNTTVTIGYDVPWRKVHELLIEAAGKIEMIDKQKKAFVFQTALSDFSVAYEINAFTREPNKMAEIYSELHKAIQDVFNKAGVEIMSPHYNAIRDGNETTLPTESRSASYKQKQFEISTTTQTQKV